MPPQRKYYIVFAGINGAGKSTLYRSGLWHTPRFPAKMKRVNSDEILREFKGDWSSQSDQLRAMREAVKRIEECFDSSDSFNQETTLSGAKSIRDIKRALEKGYEVIMFYVGVDSPDIANNRIAHRVLMGGHSIEPEVVERRFEASLENLKAAVSLCDEVYLFDNTDEFSLVKIYKKGTIEYSRKSSRVAWMKRLDYS
ncbi:MAG: zeta toxin family protein [Coriobacteriia bacterium]|nr:zeta toxin family protein [Coriobacteriia bacterium]